MDVEWGPETAWGAVRGWTSSSWPASPRTSGWRPPPRTRAAATPPDEARHPGEHASPFDPARVRADCTARRRIVLACRESRPDTHLLGARPQGLGDFPLSPHDQHQLAALTLALLALPYAGHRDYREEWRP